MRRLGEEFKGFFFLLLHFELNMEVLFLFLCLITIMYIFLVFLLFFSVILLVQIKDFISNILSLRLIISVI